MVGRWGARWAGRRFPCATGRGGIGRKRGEGDGITPAGVFRLERVLFRPDRTVASGVPLRLADGWSDDPADPDYNCHVKRPHRWRCEALWRPDPLYDLIGVLDFNRWPPRAGAGSCIFLHVWRRPRHPTEGCIAFARRDLQWILGHWQARSRVVVQP
ncbi:MAG: L,D-transpeptidase [Paracoccaceae bacterium]